MNPGTNKKHGLFYFYNAFAKVMWAYGEDTFTDGNGQKHNWRNELAQKLLSLQAPDGSLVQPRLERMVGGPAAVGHRLVRDRARTCDQVTRCCIACSCCLDSRFAAWRMQPRSRAST